MFASEDVTELMKYLETAEEKHLSYMRVGDLVLKMTTNERNFVLLTVAEVTYKSGKARKFKDLQIIYVSSNNYTLSNEEWIFLTNRSYPKHGWWTLPIDFFPEYFL